MECGENVTGLLGEVHSKIDMLQKSINQVGQVKASLKTTATDVKSQIRDSVSRHLEALRNRETWLLGQVEVVQHVKEDVLRQQQAELNKALGRLQSTCSLLEQSNKALDIESLECRVRECLEAVGELTLTPEETNVINFVARNFELQESIHKFGVVVSDNPVVDKQTLVSSCERLMLSPGKKVAFFTPSGACEDWLLKRGVDSTCEDVPKTSAATFNIHDWLQPKATPEVGATESPITSVPQQSVELWLAKCQSQGAAMETEDGIEAPDNEEIDNKGPTSVVKNKSAEIQGWLMESGKTSSTTAVFSSNLFDHYRVVKMSDSSKWLKNKLANAKEELSTNLIGETYRTIAASSPDEWLMRKAPAMASSKLLRSISTQSCSECSCGLVSMCSDTDAQEKSMEFDDTSSELSDWLAMKKEDVETNSTVTTSDQISSEFPDNDRWLMKQYHESSSLTKDHSGIKKYRESLAAQSTESWLLRQSPAVPDNKEVDEETTSGMKPYIDSLPVNYNHWLSSPPKDSGICKWLARSSTEKCKECPRMCSKGLFKVFDEITGSNDGWLMSQELY